VDFHQLRPP
jgi:hypothetical protein